MRPKTGEVSGARAARIHAGRHRRLPRIGIHIDAERCAAPIDMGVQVNQPRCYDQASANTLLHPFQCRANRSYPSAIKGHVCHPVDAL